MKSPQISNIFISRILPILLICFLGIGLYSNTFRNEFVFDDLIFIVSNPAIRDVTHLDSIWGMLSQPSRFVAFYSFALNYHFHQLDVFGYHVTNVVIHLMSGVLVWWLVGMLVGNLSRKQTSGVCLQQKITNRPPRSVYGSTVALFVALIFVAHPVQTQAVTYVTQRFASLATMFYLLAVCLYMKGREDASARLYKYYFFIGAVVAGVLGMFTKEIVITLPLMILLIEFMFLRPSETAHRPRRSVYGWGTILLFCLIIPAVFSFNVKSMLFAQKMSESHVGDVITFGKYVLTQFRVMMVFLRISFFPIGLNPDYDFSLSQNIFDLSTSLSLITWIGVLVAAIRFKKYNTLMAFGMFWFVFTLAPNFIPRRHVIFEHKLYLPMVGFAIALVVGLRHVMKDYKKYVIVLSLIVGTCSFLTFQRNSVWQDGVTLWQDVLKKSPHRLRPHMNLGGAFLRHGNFNQAIEYFTKALTIDSQHAKAYNNRGVAYGAKKQYNTALENFNQALMLNPDFDEAYNNRGNAYRHMGQNNLALADYDKAIEINPRLEDAYSNRGVIYKIQGQYDAALADYNKALEINPTYIKAYSNRGTAYVEMKKYALALEDYKNALKLNPHFWEAYYNRGIAYFNTRKYQLALADYDKVIQMNPRFEGAYWQRANIYLAMNRMEDVLKDYNNIIKLNSQNGLVYYKRSLIYKAKNQREKALQDALKAKSFGYNVDQGYINRLIK